MHNILVIRQKARDLRKRWAAHSQNPTIELSPIHTALEEIAEDILEIDVLADPKLAQVTEGRLERALGRYKLRYHARLDAPGQEHRRAFVIAHEIGHAVLGHEGDVLVDDESTVDDEADASRLDIRDGIYRSYSPRERNEVEANLFASELLAPTDALTAAIRSTEHWSVELLANTFGMSRAAMENRLYEILLAPSNDPTSATPASTTSKEIRLDYTQARAVVTPTPALILAGPGSGKTSVLVARYLRLVQRRRNRLAPDNILALTFTNKAAAEMRSRLLSALGSNLTADEKRQVQVTTFHAFGLDLVTRFVSEKGQPPHRLLSDADALFLLQDILHKLPVLPHSENLSDPLEPLKDWRDAISKLKEVGWTPKDLEDHLNEAEPQLLDELSAAPTKTVKDREDIERKKRHFGRMREMVQVYEMYQRELKERRYLDFADLILRASDILEQDADSSEREGRAPIRGRWNQILVDEFQDIDRPCGRLIAAIDGNRGNVWAVGDPRQSIYRFRGAAPEENIAWFFSAFSKSGRVLSLGNNYRSLESIVRTSGVIGQGITMHLPPEAEPVTTKLSGSIRSARSDARKAALGSHEDTRSSSHHTNDGHVQLMVTEDGATEQQAIADEIRRLSKDKGFHLKEIAILCRTKQQASEISACLEENSLPTTWLGAIENRPGFNELISVLLSIRHDSRGIARITRLSEWLLSVDNLKKLLDLAGKREAPDNPPLGLHLALRASVRAPESCGLTDDAHQCVRKLRTLLGVLRHRAHRSDRGKAPWRILAAYLFTESAEARDLLRSRLMGTLAHTPSIHRVAAWALTSGLAREFSGRADFFFTSGTAAAQVEGFLKYIEQSIAASIISNTIPNEFILGHDLVQVMTLHKSKGLEWRAVFIPNIAEGRFPLKEHAHPPLPACLVSRELNEVEEHCLFYVGASRACDLLVFSRAQMYRRDGRGAGAREPDFLVNLQRVMQISSDHYVGCSDEQRV